MYRGLTVADRTYVRCWNISLEGGTVSMRLSAASDYGHPHDAEIPGGFSSHQLSVAAPSSRYSWLQPWAARLMIANL